MRTLLIFVLLLCAPSVWAGASVIQAANCANASGSTLDITCTLASNVTAGNAVIVFAQMSTGNSTPPSYTGGDVVDGGSDSFTLLKQQDDTVNQQYGGLWYKTGSGGGFTSVTFKGTHFATAIFSSMVVMEVSGLLSNGSDTGTSQTTATGSSATNGDATGSFSTSFDGEFIIGAFMDDTASGTWTAGTSPIPFTIPANGQYTGYATTIEYGTQIAHGAINPAITNSATDGYIAIGWGFRVAAGAVPRPPTQMMMGCCAMEIAAAGQPPNPVPLPQTGQKSFRLPRGEP
jgi:hypothetical protein